MRKKNWILGLSAVGMMAILAACGGNSDAKATTASATEAAKEGTTPAAKEEKAEGNKESNGKKLKVTLLVTGSFGDKAFNDPLRQDEEDSGRAFRQGGSDHGGNGERQDQV